MVDARASKGATIFLLVLLNLLMLQQVLLTHAQIYGPDLSVVKSAPASAAPGDLIGYALSYRNDSALLSASDVIVREIVPNSSVFVAAGSMPGWSCADGSPSGTSCDFALGTLAPGSSGTLSFTVRLDSMLPAGTSQIVNTASIAGDGSQGPDPLPDNNVSVVLTPLVSATPTSSLPPGPSPTSTPTGTGTTPVVTAVTPTPSATATASGTTTATPTPSTTATASGTTMATPTPSATSTATPGPTASGSATSTTMAMPSRPATITQTRTATTVPTARATAARTRTRTATRTASATSSRTATATPSALPSSTAEPRATPPLIADMAVVKRVDPPQVRVGDRALLTINVRNLGGAPAAAVSVIDELPDFLDLLDVRSTRGSIQADGKRIAVVLGPVAPGELIIVTLLVRVNKQVLPPANSSVAIVQSNLPNDPPGNNSSRVVVELLPGSAEKPGHSAPSPADRLPLRLPLTAGEPVDELAVPQRDTLLMGGILALDAILIGLMLRRSRLMSMLRR